MVVPSGGSFCLETGSITGFEVALKEEVFEVMYLDLGIYGGFYSSIYSNFIVRALGLCSGRRRNYCVLSINQRQMTNLKKKPR